MQKKVFEEIPRKLGGNRKKHSRQYSQILRKTILRRRRRNKEEKKYLERNRWIGRSHSTNYLFIYLFIGNKLQPTIYLFIYLLEIN